MGMRPHILERIFEEDAVVVQSGTGGEPGSGTSVVLRFKKFK